MSVRKQPFRVALTGLFVHALFATGSPTLPTKKPAVLWRNPDDIATRNLFYGPGGKGHQPPRGTFTFVKEDLKGTNPKFFVRDRDGVLWKVKLGIEARPETVASRIVWAAGYFADEDYFEDRLQVRGMPVRLHRGQKFVGPDGVIYRVRLKREEGKGEKEGEWSWRHNPFTGSREWNGLRTVMALINDWDLKDENNAIRDNGAERIYLVSDLGATFGTSGRSWPFVKERGDLESYRRDPLIRRLGGEYVDFRAPFRPKFVFLVNPLEYVRRVELEWVGHHVPREDARWMGRLMSRLSRRQIEEAFRAGGYSAAEAAAFADVLEKRIEQLSDL